MADDRRIERIQSRIRQDIAEMFLGELKDPRQKGIVTITRVKVSKDLTHARIYYSVMGSEADRRSVERFITGATPMIQARVAKGLEIRVAPKLAFQYDEAIEKQASVSKLIDDALAADRAGRAEDADTGSEEE